MWRGGAGSVGTVTVQVSYNKVRRFVIPLGGQSS